MLVTWSTLGKLKRSSVCIVQCFPLVSIIFSSLRTLEFWVDNLNPLFLYPEMSKQVDVFTSLMQSLSRHLRPAPYPYGLLTLRLLGKLGGKNRIFLREPLQLPSNTIDAPDPVSFPCKWIPTSGITSDTGESFNLLIPLSRCTNLLRSIIVSPVPMDEKRDILEQADEHSDVILWKDCDRLWNCQIDRVDYNAYARNIMEETKSAQAMACVKVISAAVGTMDKWDIREAPRDAPFHEKRFYEMDRDDFETRVRSALLGLFYGSVIEASAQLSWATLEEVLSKSAPEWVALAMSDLFSTPIEKAADTGIEVLRRVFKEGKYLDGVRRDRFLNALIARLCDSCSLGSWKEKVGPQKALISVLSELDTKQRMTYEFRLVSTGFIFLKSVPRELSMASVEGLRFFIRLCVLLYDLPKLSDATGECRLDPILMYPIKIEGTKEAVNNQTEKLLPDDDTVKLVLQELGSSQLASR